jgi:hypothetical protein
MIERNHAANAAIFLVFQGEFGNKKRPPTQIKDLERLGARKKQPAGTNPAGFYCQ